MAAGEEDFTTITTEGGSTTIITIIMATIEDGGTGEAGHTRKSIIIM